MKNFFEKLAKGFAGLIVGGLCGTGIGLIIGGILLLVVGIPYHLFTKIDFIVENMVLFGAVGSRIGYVVGSILGIKMFLQNKEGDIYGSTFNY